MDLGLRGRVAAVAGGSSGLGLAVARALAAEGCHVALASRSEERLAEARDAVLQRGNGGEVVTAALDVRDAGAVRAWIDGVAERFGALHVVLANGGGPPAGTATAHDLEAYRDALALTLLPQIAMAQAALPHLRAAGWGRLLFLTSYTVRQPVPNLALSNVSRVGVVGYVKSLVEDLAGEPITANVLAPGWHLTDRLGHVLGDDVEAELAAIAQTIPLRRIGDPADFGAIAAFLASEQAGFITGAVIPIDGGQVRNLL